MHDTTSQSTSTETETTTAAEAASTGQEAGQQGQEGAGQEAKQEEVKVFRAWEEDGKEEASQQEKGKIPYSRFKEVNDERVAHQTRVSELEVELSRFRTRSEELDKIKPPDDIKPEDFKTPQEFLKARDEALKNAAIKEVEDRFIARETQRLEAERNAQIMGRFEKNVEEVSKENPEILQAVAYLDKHAHNLHPAIARELLEDENAAKVIHAIATNQEALTKLFRGSPQDAIRLIHKTSARLEAAPAAASTPAQEQGSAASVPAALKPGGVPVTVKGGAKVPTKDVSKMSQKEYRAFKANGYK